MAKKNEILLSIALEGDAEIKSKLQAVGEASKRSLGEIDKNLGEVQKRFGSAIRQDAFARPVARPEGGAGADPRGGWPWPDRRRHRRRRPAQPADQGRRGGARHQIAERQ